MLTRNDLTNIVTGMLVTNQNKTDKEKSEIIMQFLEKESCLKIEKEEDDFILNVLITIALVIAYNLILHIFFKKYKTDLIKDMSNLEQIFMDSLFVIAFVVLNVFPFIFMHKSIKQKKWKRIGKK